MTKKQKGLCAAAAAGVLLICTAITQRDTIQKYCADKQAVSAAQRYLQQKYGIKGTVLETSNLFSYTNVRFKDQDMEYCVYLDAEQQPLLDTYQYDEMTAALKKQIADRYPDCLDIQLSLSGPEWYIEETGDTVRSQFGLDADNKYDGSNLDAVLTGCKVDLTAVFAETDFTDFPLAEQLKAWDADGTLFSFDTKEHAEESLNSPYFTDAALWRDGVMYAPHITQMCTFDSKSHSSEIKKYQLNEGDGFLFFSPDVPDARCIGPEPLPVQSLTETYQFNTGTAAVYVYYPTAALPEYGKLCAVCDPCGKNDPQELELTRCGDYTVFVLSSRDNANPRWTLIQKQQ